MFDTGKTIDLLSDKYKKEVVWFYVLDFSIYIVILYNKCWSI
jgi:hypothetical protein